MAKGDPTGLGGAVKGATGSKGAGNIAGAAGAKAGVSKVQPLIDRLNSASQMQQGFNKFQPNMGGVPTQKPQGAQQGGYGPQSMMQNIGTAMNNSKLGGIRPTGQFGNQGGGFQQALGNIGQIGGMVSGLPGLWNPNANRMQGGAEDEATRRAGIGQAYQQMLGRAPTEQDYGSWMGNNDYWNQIGKSQEAQQFQQQQPSLMNNPQPQIDWNQYLTGPGMMHTMDRGGMGWQQSPFGGQGGGFGGYGPSMGGMLNGNIAPWMRGGNPYQAINM